MLDAECRSCDEVVRDADHARGFERMEEHIDTKHGGSGWFDVTIRSHPANQRPRELCGDCAEWVRPRPDGTLPPHPSGGVPAECQETLSVLGSGDPDTWPDHPDKPSQHHDPDGPRDDPGRGKSQGPPASGSTQGPANQESEVTS